MNVLVHLNDLPPPPMAPAYRLALPADAVRQKPRPLVLNFQNAAQLMGANALLLDTIRCTGCTHLQRHARRLENRADADSELLAAFVALPQAGPYLFADTR